jgi:hypothetical protein
MIFLCPQIHPTALPLTRRERKSQPGSCADFDRSIEINATLGAECGTIASNSFSNYYPDGYLFSVEIAATGCTAS